LHPSKRIKSIAVVGGGPAGANTAMIAALRGHNVTLFEKRDERRHVDSGITSGNQIRYSQLQSLF